MTEHPSIIDAAEERRLYEASLAGRDEPIRGWPSECVVCAKPLRYPGRSSTCSATCETWRLVRAEPEPEDAA